jgi:hypothetical protein
MNGFTNGGRASKQTARRVRVAIIPIAMPSVSTSTPRPKLSWRRES